METHIVPTYWLCCRGSFRKGTMASASTSVWEKAALLVFILMPDIHFLPTCPWSLSSYCPIAGAQSERVQVSPRMGPLKGRPGTPAALCPAQPYRQKLWNFASQHGNPGVRELGVELGPFTPQWGPLQLRYPSQFLITTLGCCSISALDISS